MPSNKKLKCKNNKIRNKEDSMRKQFLIALTAITCLLSACSTANFAYYDDIYSSTDENKVAMANPAAAQTAVQQGTVEADSIIYETDENGNLLRTLTYYPGSSEPVITTYMEVVDGNASTASSYSYDPDDYYDYCYASRIRRFHTDVYAGWGYYDPYFTNMYWYDYCPASWGISIYLGYNWWWPGYCYRPYWYNPYWYDYGFHYGWGWYGPHYAYYDPWYHPHGPHGPHGPEPIDYYHNHHDHNNAYYYGHRNNVGPSVGNGGPGHEERPNKDGEGTGRPLAGGYGNGETNNYYSVTSSPASFNQRYDQLAGTTGVGSAGNGGGSMTGRTTTSASTTAAPTNTSDARINQKVNPTNLTQGASQPTTTPSMGTTTTPVTPKNPSATGARTNTTTVTRTVVTPSSTSRPTGTSTPTRTVTRTVTNARPASTSGSYSNPASNSSSARPASSSRSASSSRPTTTAPSSSRSSNSAPRSESRPSSSSSTSNSRSNYSSPSSSRSSAPSSSSRSVGSSSSHSYSSGGSHSSGGHSGGGHSGGGHATGRR